MRQVAPNGPCSSCNMRGYVSFHTFVALSATSHRIDLENLSLQSIPFELSQAADAHRLSLENNLIVELPNDWLPLVNLVELRLGSNKIESLPIGLSVLSTLLGLHVENNRLTKIPVALASLNRLRRLDAHSNPIEAIDIVFGQFWGQMELSLDIETLINPSASQLSKTGRSRGDILEVLDAWGRSRITRALCLTHRNLQEFPAISEWTTSEYVQLTSMDLSHNMIQVIPSWLECMSNLKNLKLIGNPIRSISRQFATGLPHLVKLDVDWLNVENNPGLPWIESGWESIKKWWIFLEESSSRLELASLDLADSNLHEVGLICGSRLQSLHIKNCRISAVSPYWSLLMNLSTLDMLKSELMDVQAEPFHNMHLLSSFSVSDCSISRISPGFFLSKWHLTCLNLSSNRLTMLPSSVGFATSLTNINLDKNQLCDLPDTWTSLKSLKICTIRKNVLSNDMEDLLMNESELCILDLSHNRLEKFPLNPEYHTRLQSLDVSHNMLTGLKHNNFSHLKKLQKFKANDNMLQEPMLELPIILQVNTELTCIDFSGNPMSSLPENCKKNAANMITLLKTLLSIRKTHEIRADYHWDSDTLSFLLERSDGCILQATLQNLRLSQHPNQILCHDLVILDLSHNCIDHISQELLRLSALKSISLAHNVIQICKLQDVSLSCIHVLQRF